MSWVYALNIRERPVLRGSKDVSPEEFGLAEIGEYKNQGVILRFSRRTNRAELSMKGQKWMLNMMLCLQRELIPEATSVVGVTCTSLEKKAFASHGRCYMESGLCTLSPTDWLAIIRIVDYKTLFASTNSRVSWFSMHLALDRIPPVSRTFENFLVVLSFLQFRRSIDGVKLFPRVVSEALG
ncbi:hypothetical protein FPV67DRAFT_1650215 [Lyophyllum atratum]|nr:hypothetical protein FPV67DRAFT_1650215 [Lyophyllum atratum]